jgi:hypothetical protein
MLDLISPKFSKVDRLLTLARAVPIAEGRMALPDTLELGVADHFTAFLASDIGKVSTA